MSSMMRLQLIGGGRMGEALLGGLLQGGWADLDEIAVVEQSEARRAELERQFVGLLVTSEPLQEVDAVLAVKPNDATMAARELQAAGVSRVLSIVAGVTTAALEAEMVSGVKVIRAMPNTPALVGAGAAAIAAGRYTTSHDLAWASEVLQAVGTVEVCDESLLDAVTGLSGSGPAYVFWLAEALIAAGQQVGLTVEMADALTRQTLLGAARLLTESSQSPAQLRAAVTSPQGTTAKGIETLEAYNVAAAVVAAVRAAAERSRELGTA